MTALQPHIDRDDPSLWRELAQQLRVDAVRATAAAGSGHPSSGMSAADLTAVLLAGHLHYDFDHPQEPANDHLIFSKGHASPLLYALYRAVGAITDDELMSYRRLGSRLEGHPTPGLHWVDVATGSLGLGHRRHRRRGRAVADGPRGHRDVPRRPRQHGARHLRRQPDRRAG